MILVAYGGSGSTYVRGRASRIYRKAFSLVDVDFKPVWWMEGNSCPVKSYQEFPTVGLCEYFKNRTGYVMSLYLSIERNIFDFIEMHKEDCFLHFTFATQMEFFSRNKIKDVFFIVRDPVNQAVSYLHPEHGTHGKDENTVDILSEEGALLFTRMWNENVAEYLRLKDMGLNPVLLRFENMTKEAKTYPLFEGFIGDSDHYGKLPKDIQDSILFETIEMRSKLYFEVG